MATRNITAHYLGRVAYRETHDLQEALLEARIQGRIGDTLLLLEHEPTITLGRGADGSNVLVTPELRKQLGVDLVETGRGGDVTYHAPGQLVAYPIFDLKPDRCDVRKYVQDLAAIMVALAARHGIGAGVIEGDSKLIGVWVDKKNPGVWPERNDDRSTDLFKIGAIGVRLSRWVTMHGFAFNGTTDLGGFGLILPCGIRQYGVTSLADLAQPSASPVTVRSLAEEVLPLFAKQFDADVAWASAQEGQHLEALRGERQRDQVSLETSP
jgi:lipoyl(octanoyl) transferase